MEFELIQSKSNVMKNLALYIVLLLLASGCATTKESRSTKVELRKERVLAKQESIQRAVESRRFIIRFDKLYFSTGGRADLLPRSNFLIVDGNKAIISTAYLGRHYGAFPIAGIKLQERYQQFDLIKNQSKGTYEIKMRVTKGADTFDIYVTIGKNGNCDTSVNSLMIDNVRYTGQIVPMKETQIVETQETLRI
jgi:hypothetical protein